MTPHFRIFLVLVLAGCLAGYANAQTVTSTRIESASWTCRDATGAVLSSHERQDKAQEACTNRALAEPGKSFEIRPSGFRIVATLDVEQPAPNTAALSWQYTQGEVPATSFTIHYGPSADMLHEVVQVNDINARTYTLENLAAGTYYFAVRARSAEGVESAPSNVVSKVIS